jgi:hypothetical protein
MFDAGSHVFLPEARERGDDGIDIEFFGKMFENELNWDACTLHDGFAREDRRVNDDAFCVNHDVRLLEA